MQSSLFRIDGGRWRHVDWNFVERHQSKWKKNRDLIIYEYLFNDGAIVAKKEARHQILDHVQAN